MKVPALDTIFELEDDIRRTEQQLKVQRWAHGLLLKGVTNDPQTPWHKVSVSRIWYRIQRLRDWLRMRRHRQPPPPDGGSKDHIRS